MRIVARSLAYSFRSAIACPKSIVVVRSVGRLVEDSIKGKDSRLRSGRRRRCSGCGGGEVLIGIVVDTQCVWWPPAARRTGSTDGSMLRGGVALGCSTTATVIEGGQTRSLSLSPLLNEINDEKLHPLWSGVAGGRGHGQPSSERAGSGGGGGCGDERQNCRPGERRGGAEAGNGSGAEISLGEIRDACLSPRNLSQLVSAPHTERSALHKGFCWNI